MASSDNQIPANSVTLSMAADDSIQGWPDGYELIREMEVVDGKPICRRAYFAKSTPEAQR